MANGARYDSRTCESMKPIGRSVVSRQFEAWLHPNGWQNRRRDWEQLPTGLMAIRDRLTYVPVPGAGPVAIVFPSVIPHAPDDPIVEFTVRIPSAAAHGARLDWPRLCQYAETP